MIELRTPTGVEAVTRRTHARLFFDHNTTIPPCYAHLVESIDGKQHRQRVWTPGCSGASELRWVRIPERHSA